MNICCGAAVYMSRAVIGAKDIEVTEALDHADNDDTSLKLNISSTAAGFCFIKRGTISTGTQWTNGQQVTRIICFPAVVPAVSH